jgi:hypothetical protein
MAGDPIAPWRAYLRWRVLTLWQHAVDMLTGMVDGDVDPTPRPIALVLRVYVDAAGLLHGRIVDPASQTVTPFTGATELVALVDRLARNTAAVPRDEP